jgi:hypothetical protein
MKGLIGNDFERPLQDGSMISRQHPVGLSVTGLAGDGTPIDFTSP